jgi:very-short-patch-repair endonuclease
LRGGLGRGFSGTAKTNATSPASLRNDTTPAEKRLWHFLRAGKLGVKFRRQAASGAYIVDFVCFSHRLIVERDGPQHAQEQGQVHEARRTVWRAS